MFFSFLISYFVNNLIIYISHKYDIFIDQKDKPQGFHTDHTPRAGGIGVMSALVLYFTTKMGTALVQHFFFLPFWRF